MKFVLRCGLIFSMNLYALSYVVGSFHVENVYRHWFSVVDAKMHEVLLSTFTKRRLGQARGRRGRNLGDHQHLRGLKPRKVPEDPLK